MKTRFSASTPLEQQVAAVLASSRAVVREGETLSEIEKKGLEGLTAKEAEERKAELAKIRALQTYQEAKFRRQGKIKSKKFRKIARKEKEKEKLQELERLQATDPEAAKEKLEEMEKVSNSRDHYIKSFSGENRRAGISEAQECVEVFTVASEEGKV